MKRFFATFAFFAVTSCGADSRLDLASVSPQANIPKIVLLGGADQVGEVGTTLPIAVKVRVTNSESERSPLANQLLLWIVTKGAGKVEIDTTRTDAHGKSEQRWTLGTFATGDSLDVWMISSAGKALGYISVGATATHGEAVAGRQQCDPIALIVAANVAVPIVDSIQVYASDRYNNIWPYIGNVTVEGVQFSGRISGSAAPPATFTANTVTLAPSTFAADGGQRSWQGGWVITLGLGGPDHTKCIIGATAH